MSCEGFRYFLNERHSENLVQYNDIHYTYQVNAFQSLRQETLAAGGAGTFPFTD